MKNFRHFSGLIQTIDQIPAGNMFAFSGKIVDKKYRRPLNINIGIIIFAVMFLYILICVALFFTKGNVKRYEVRSGSLSISNVYEGIILREETIVSANSSGYINYFSREGEHVASGDLSTL